METGDVEEDEASTVGLEDQAWRNVSDDRSDDVRMYSKSISLEVCDEVYPGGYPALYSTPAYNFFYIEVAQLRPSFSLAHFNMPLMLLLIGVWIILWITMLAERFRYGRLIWNNMPQWIIVVPWIWTAILVTTAISNLSMNKNLRKIFRVGAKEIVTGLTDAFEVALYIHSASVGTELITGKGLNRYANGHIDPLLNNENVWHSSLVLLLSGLHAGGAALCALVDSKQPSSTSMHESTLWIFPMYSKCTSLGNYSHFMSTCVFLGLCFSYITVAFVLLKTALHIIFEYKVTLVFVEQLVVGALLMTCAGLSLIFTTHGGVALLEGMETLMTGVAGPLICLLELVALIYMYGSHDFTSDINVAMEDSACPTRVSMQWQIIPFVTLCTLITKMSVLVDSEIPEKFMLLGIIPVACIIVALPLRALYNVYSFLNPRGDTHTA